MNGTTEIPTETLLAMGERLECLEQALEVAIDEVRRLEANADEHARQAKASAEYIWEIGTEIADANRRFGEVILGQMGDPIGDDWCDEARLAHARACDVDRLRALASNGDLARIPETGRTRAKLSPDPARVAAFVGDDHGGVK